MVDVADRVRALEQVGLLLGGPAEQRSIHRLQRRRLLVEGHHVIPDRHARHPDAPQIGIAAELHQRDVAAPRPAGDHRALAIDVVALQQIVQPRRHVVHVGEPGVAGQRVTPGTPVPGRTPVVRHRHQEPRVDIGLDLGHVAVDVQPMRSAVDEHHHGVRAVAVGLDDPAVHVLPLPVSVAPVAERPARRRLADCDRLLAAIGQHTRSRGRRRCARTRRCRRAGRGHRRSSRGASRSSSPRRWRRRRGARCRDPRTDARPGRPWRRGTSAAPGGRRAMDRQVEPVVGDEIPDRDPLLDRPARGRPRAAGRPRAETRRRRAPPTCRRLVRPRPRPSAGRRSATRGG